MYWQFRLRILSFMSSRSIFRRKLAAYPELRLVAVMHGDELSYAETFDKALQGLFDKQIANIITEKDVGDVFTIEELISQANTAFENYIKFLGEKRYNDASNALQELENN